MKRGSKRDLRICGTGAAVPANVLSSEEIDARLGIPIGTVFKRYGVRVRHYSKQETAAELGVKACEQALQRAGLSWNDIDCLVATSATMDQALPYNAAMILAELGSKVGRISAFDVGASCLSFLVGLDTISYLIEAGRYNNVVIVSSDIATVALDWATPGESAIFGDGAAAVVVRKSVPDEHSLILSSQIETYANGANDCHIKAGGSRYHPRRAAVDFAPLTFFHMDGPRLFRTVSKELPRVVSQLLDAAALTLEEIQLFIPHQASRLALDHLTKRLGVDATRVINILADFGNQVGASLPTALHYAIESKRLERGQRAMLLGSGAGLTIGGMVIEY